MVWTHVRHQVEDYDNWKRVFDTTAEVKSQYGWKRYRIFEVEGKRTDLLVMEEFESVEQLKQFMESDFLRSAMSKAGVTSQPEVMILDGLEEGTA